MLTEPDLQLIYHHLTTSTEPDFKKIVAGVRTRSGEDFTDEEADEALGRVQEAVDKGSHPVLAIRNVLKNPKLTVTQKVKAKVKAKAKPKAKKKASK